MRLYIQNNHHEINSIVHPDLIWKWGKVILILAVSGRFFTFLDWVRVGGVQQLAQVEIVVVRWRLIGHKLGAVSTVDLIWSFQKKHIYFKFFHSLFNYLTLVLAVQVQITRRHFITDKIITTKKLNRKEKPQKCVRNLHITIVSTSKFIALVHLRYHQSTF